MAEDKDNWIEEVFLSMKGSERARPSHDLLAKIQSRMEGRDNKVVTLYQWKFTAAAAVLLVFMNTMALIYFSQEQLGNYSDVVSESAQNQSIISTYQIY